MAVLYGRLAQLVRALRLHRRCRGFESLSAHISICHPLKKGYTRIVDCDKKHTQFARRANSISQWMLGVI
jgi:hypothetical protein